MTTDPNAPASDMPGEGAPRFFIDHDMIHDRITGQHVHGNRDIEPSIADDSITMLNDLHYSALREIKRATAQPPARREGMPEYPAVIMDKLITGDKSFDWPLIEQKDYDALRARCEELQEDLRQRRITLSRVDRTETTREIWYWQDDGQDYLESLGCPVLVRPDVIRRFVAAESRCEELAGERDGLREQLLDESDRADANQSLVSDLRAQLAAAHQRITSLCEVFDCKPSELLTRTKELAAQSRWIAVKSAPLGKMVALIGGGWRHEFPGQVCDAETGECVLDSPTPQHPVGKHFATHWRDLPPLPLLGEQDERR